MQTSIAASSDSISIRALSNWQKNAGVGLETGNISGAGGNNNNGSSAGKL